MSGERSYGEITHNSPQLIFRLSHRRRLALALSLVQPGAGEEILDFGAGDGALVASLADQAPQTEFTLLEPYLVPELALSLNSPRISWAQSVSDLGDTRFDKIVCLEVLEHLSPEALDEALPLFRRRLKPGGLCMISIPLEVGPPALFKYAVRRAAGRLHGGMSVSTAMKSFVLRTNAIPRQVVGGYIPSHVGFNAFSTMARVVKETGFRIERRITSPLSVLPWFMNSQIYYLLRAEA